MKSDFLSKANKRNKDMCIDTLEMKANEAAQLILVEQQHHDQHKQLDKDTEQQLQQADDQPFIVTEQQTQKPKTKNIKSRKSLQINDIMLNKDLLINSNGLDRPMEQLGKKLQILNETNSKIYIQQQQQQQNSININLSDDSSSSCVNVNSNTPGMATTATNNNEQNKQQLQIRHVLSDDSFLKPKKSCLSKCKFSKQNNLNIHLSSSDEDSNDDSPQTSDEQVQQLNEQIQKKRVTFADVHGRDLYSIKLISEPSDCPPRLLSKSVKFFLEKEFNEQIIYEDEECESPAEPNGKNDAKCEINNNTTSTSTTPSQVNVEKKLNIKNAHIIVYTLNFEQPAGDYLHFQEKLKNKYVSLENVILNRFNINGTIKVNNICYHKNVFVRCTFDNWKTSQDYPATYVPNTFQFSPNTYKSPTDTFKFEFTLPNKKTTADTQISLYVDKLNTLKQFKSTFNGSHCQSAAQQSNNQIEFCVCFKSEDGQEHWDSNNGANYSILKYVLDLNINLNEEHTATAKQNGMGIKQNSLTNNTNYLQLLIQEQHLNTLIDNYFHNWIYTNRHRLSAPHHHHSSPNLSAKSCSNDTWLQQQHHSHLDMNIPYW